MTIHENDTSKPTQLAYIETRLDASNIIDLDYSINRLGGHPTVFPNTSFPFPYCSRCQHPLFLLCQLHVPSSEQTTQEKNAPQTLLYIFGCNTNECMQSEGSFKAIRGTSPSSEKMKKKPFKTKQRASKEKFGFHLHPFQWTSPSTSDPFTFSFDSFSASLPQDLNTIVEDGTDEKKVEEEEEVEEMRDPGHMRLSHGSAEDMLCAKLAQCTWIDYAFPSYSLGFEMEEVLNQSKKKGLEMKPSTLDEEGEVVREEYEKPKRRFPKLLHRFLKRCEQSPRQVLRYDGNPLMYSDWTIVHGPSYCSSCGGNWRFKYQLMPSVLSILPIETMAQNSNRWHSGMEFGTILVFTCENRCKSHDPYIEEQCIVHLERS